MPCAHSWRRNDLLHVHPRRALAAAGGRSPGVAALQDPGMAEDNLIYLSTSIISQLVSGFIGYILGVLVVWLVVLPALNYRDVGFWWIAYIRENPPKDYEYCGALAKPIWRKRKK